MTYPHDTITGLHESLQGEAGSGYCAPCESGSWPCDAGELAMPPFRRVGRSPKVIYPLTDKYHAAVIGAALPRGARRWPERDQRDTCV
jgi:hypothetical protein